MAFPASFTKFDIAVIQITDLPDCCIAFLSNKAHLSRRQAYLCIVALFGEQLGSTSGSAH
jgi:hypothetical protein